MTLDKALHVSVVILMVTFTNLQMTDASADVRLSLENPCFQGQDCTLNCSAVTGSKTDGYLYVKDGLQVVSCSSPTSCTSINSAFQHDVGDSKSSSLTMINFNPASMSGSWHCRDGSSGTPSNTYSVILNVAPSGNLSLSGDCPDTGSCTVNCSCDELGSPPATLILTGSSGQLINDTTSPVTYVLQASDTVTCSVLWTEFPAYPLNIRSVTRSFITSGPSPTPDPNCLVCIILFSILIALCAFGLIYVIILCCCCWLTLMGNDPEEKPETGLTLTGNDPEEKPETGPTMTGNDPEEKPEKDICIHLIILGIIAGIILIFFIATLVECFTKRCDYLQGGWIFSCVFGVIVIVVIIVVIVVGLTRGRKGKNAFTFDKGNGGGTDQETPPRKNSVGPKPTPVRRLPSLPSRDTSDPSVGAQKEQMSDEMSGSTPPEKKKKRKKKQTEDRPLPPPGQHAGAEENAHYATASFSGSKAILTHKTGTSHPVENIGQNPNVLPPIGSSSMKKKQPIAASSQRD